jgi:hypothetical protein
MADLTYKQLQQAVTELGKNVARASEAIRVKAKQIDEEATDTARVAEMIGAMSVDNATVAETRELAKITAGLSQAAIAYATAGDNTTKAAQAAHDQARTTHGGIQEAVSRSNVAGIHDVNREWLRQE